MCQTACKHVCWLVYRVLDMTAERLDVFFRRKSLPTSTLVRALFREDGSAFRFDTLERWRNNDNHTTTDTEADSGAENNTGSLRQGAGKPSQEDAECPICYEPLPASETLAMACQHYCAFLNTFHAECISRWTRRGKRTFPLCRCRKRPD